MRVRIKTHAELISTGWQLQEDGCYSSPDRAEYTIVPEMVPWFGRSVDVLMGTGYYYIHGDSDQWAWTNGMLAKERIIRNLPEWF